MVKNVEKKVRGPVEGEFFRVIPRKIEQEKFKKSLEDPRQEKTRLIIEEAFGELKNNPSKYAKPFKILIPKKDWKVKTVGEMKELANNMGGHITDWVEQALEWSQRINNGESWEDVCNNPDTLQWYRIIIWKNGYARLVGGASNVRFASPASDIYKFDHFDDNLLYTAVPSIAIPL